MTGQLGMVGHGTAIVVGEGQCRPTGGAVGSIQRLDIPQGLPDRVHRHPEPALDSRSHSVKPSATASPTTIT